MATPANPIAQPVERTRGPKVQGLTEAASHGMMWGLAQAGVVKTVTMVQQFVLTWLLLPEQAGLVSLGLTITAFAGLLQQGGLRQVLVTRQAKFALWATPAFWLGLTQGLVAAAFVVIAAPIAASSWVYDDPRLLPLMLVMALTSPLDAACIVPQSKLSIDLRFKFLAGLNVFNAVGQFVLTILLAKLGFGAYSIVVPRIPILVVLMALMWWRSGARVHMRLQVQRWKYLFADSIYVILGLFCANVANQGGAMALGITTSAGVVGVFGQANNLSLQTIKMVTMQAEDVLFSSLNKLSRERERQTAAFLRATSVLAAVAIPLSLLQAAAAEPLLHAFFKEDWWGAIPLLQILSLGMAFLAAAIPAHSFLQAQGRFKAYFRVSLSFLILYVAMVVAGGLTKRSDMVAWAVAAYYFITSFLIVWIAIRPSGRGFGPVIRVLAPPAVLGGVASGAGYFAARAIPEMAVLSNARATDIVRLAVIGLLSVGIYLPLLRAASPETWRELLKLAHRLTRRGKSAA